MATKKATKKEVETKAVVTNNTILRGARVTEKAARLTTQNAYVFMVAPTTTKPEIKKAFILAYKKTPVKIAITTIKQKRIVARGRRGKLAGGKKAVVYLKKGETIDIA